MTSAPVISFMSANYVAREVGYADVREWGPCDEAANEFFAPLDTFAERFDGVLSMISGAGFDTIDLWTAHLNWRWATPEHVDIANRALAGHGLAVASIAGGLGSTPEELAAACRLARGVGTTILGGMAPILISDRDATVDVLRDHGVRLGLENHPERTPDEVLEKIGDADVLGATVDTGWFATHGYDPASAIRELGDRVIHAHLKDIERPGEHETVPHGEGCVDIAACVEALAEIGYAGAYSVEHEPWDEDPTADCVVMKSALSDLFERAGKVSDV